MKNILKTIVAGALFVALVPFGISSPAHATAVVPFGAAEVATGYDGACALSNGSVYCWGVNDYSQVGNPALTSRNERLPIKVSASGSFLNENVTLVSMAETDTCAVEDGVMYCWGLNYYGSDGNGSRDPLSVATPVSANGDFTNTAVTAMETSADETCAIEDAVLYCWGYNQDSEIGIGTVTESEPLPQKVSANGNFHNTHVTDLSIGTNEICALEAGKMFCWGNNDYGQLGIGSTVSVSLPTEVQPNPSASFTNDDITSIATTEFVNCAVRHGVTYCWGIQVAIGQGEGGDTYLPRAVHSNDGFMNTAVTAVSVDDQYACALEAAVLYCWGENYQGQLGVGDNANHYLPMKVLANGDFKNASVTGLSAGEGAACVIEAHRVFCVGDAGDDYADLSATWPSYSNVMLPVWGALSPRNPTLNLGTVGYTEWDQTVYDQGLPKEVRKQTSIKMLQPHQTATLKLVSQTPTKCLAAKEQVLFIATGACRIQVVRKADGEAVLTRITTVTKKSIHSLGVGNPAGMIKKVAFKWETTAPKNMDTAEWDRIKSNVSFTGIAFVVGYTHAGEGPKSSFAFARKRAKVVRRHLAQPDISIETFGLGSNNPIAYGDSRAQQQKNERVMIYMIGTHVHAPPG